MPRIPRPPAFERFQRVSLWPFILPIPAEVLYIRIATQEVLPEPASFLHSVLPLYVLGLAASMGLILWMRWRIRPPVSWAGWATRYGVASVLGTLVLLVAFRDAHQSGAPIIAVNVLIVMARLSNTLLIAFFVDTVLSSWRTAAASTRNLFAALAHVSQVNTLLEEAERSMHAQQRSIIRTQVIQPVRTLARTAGERSDADVADSVDELVSGTMRPLAHQLHPVTLSLGLVASLRSLSDRCMVDADPTVVALDALGELLDPGVRLQVYRWVRTQTRKWDPDAITLKVAERRLEVRAVGAEARPTIDAMMAVAGIEALEPGDGAASGISAPLRGQHIDQVGAGLGTWNAPPPSVSMQIPRYSLVSALTADPSRRLAWTAAIAALALPTVIFLSLARGSLAGSAVLLVWLVVPVLVSGLLGLVPVRQGSRASAAWVVLSWLVVGLVAGFSEWGAAQLAAESLTQGGQAESSLALSVVRGITRFTLSGLLITVARGALTTARSSDAQLREQLEAELGERMRLLEESDRLDRHVAEKLHRAVQGRLSAISLLLRLGRREEAINELDVLAYSTLPALASSLTASLGVASREFIDASEVPPSLHVEEAIDESLLASLPDPLVAQLRSFAAECAVNAARHGGATTVTVSLQQESGEAILTCRDDGCGMPEQSRPGLGSALFAEVARSVRGDWRFVPSVDGTVVSLRFPLVPAAP